MCDAHAVQPADHRLGRRAKLPEVGSQWHCTIIGTCLSLAEIRSVVAKFRLRFPNDPPTDYQLHTAAIHLAGHDRNAGKMLTRMLDRKHAQTIVRFGKAADEAALRLLWNEALARGDVAAACWAAMSHAAATDVLRNQIFADVHMLSHQVGATARADLRRLHELAEEKAELAAKVARQQDRLRDEIGRRDGEIRDLRQLLDEQIAETRRLAHLTRAAAELDRLRDLAADLGRQLDDERRRRRTIEAEQRAIQAERDETECQLARLSAANAELADENRALEARLLMSAGSEACDDECRSLNLCGRCILFVGGRNQHVPHFRRLVEAAGGEFAHHDGGVEEAMGRLNGLCGRADAVLFPVDCISHRAQDEVKQLCRRWDKPVFPLRRTGLGAFIRALETMAAGGAGGEPGIEPHDA